MTGRENRDYYEGLWRQSRSRTWKVLLFFVLAIALMMLSSCKTKYVTVPEYHEKLVSRTDTVWKTDSVKDVQISIVQEVDSSYLAKLGIINPPEKAYLVQNTNNKTSSSSLIEHKTDTIIQIDSITKIVIQEKELSKWQRLKLDAGGAAICLAVALFLLLLFKIFRK